MAVTKHQAATGALPAPAPSGGRVWRRQSAAAGKGLQAAGYPGLDIFRFAAAFLVVAVHVSPLLSVNETADFLFTRVLCRLAVPFFFMASGFFLCRPGQAQGAAQPTGAGLRAFSVKILKLYGIAVLLYLPLNLYMGYFTGASVGAVVWDVVWDGTFYHLWYFPAVLLGAWVAFGLLRGLGRKGALAAAALLYIVGLGGDSWYSLAAGVPALQAVYGFLFRFFDYTRNGLFFAPLFLLLGMVAAAPRPAARRPAKAGWAAVGLALSLAAMVAEALWLRAAGPLRHDSMYLALPFAAWFLFSLLRRAGGVAHPRLRKAATLIYLLHPWAIVVLHKLATALAPGQEYSIANPLFYLAVCAASAAVALPLATLPKLRRRAAQARAWAEVDAAALCHNYHEMRRLLPRGCRVMAVVKADAYGHGAPFVARTLQKAGATGFAVATLEEGIQLRRHGVRGLVLVLGVTPPQQARRLWLYRLTQTVPDAAYAAQLSARRWPVKVHVKVDTGMHRLGIAAARTDDIAGVYALPHLRPTGIYSHLSRADSLDAEDVAFTHRQADLFFETLGALAARGIKYGQPHLQSSYGVLNLPCPGCAWARVGIALYGTLSHGAPTMKKPALQPALALRATVASLRTVPAGEWVGYGRTYRCETATTLAVIPLGYADGLPRSLAGGRVLVRGHSAPLVGRISMDQCVADVSHIPGVAAGDVATFIGADGDETITATQVAAAAGTITNDLLAGLGRRVLRRPSQPVH